MISQMYTTGGNEDQNQNLKPSPPRLPPAIITSFYPFYARYKINEMGIQPDRNLFFAGDSTVTIWSGCLSEEKS